MAALKPALPDLFFTFLLALGMFIAARSLVADLPGLGLPLSEPFFGDDSAVT